MGPGTSLSLCVNCPTGLSTNVTGTTSASGCTTCAPGYIGYSSGSCSGNINLTCVSTLPLTIPLGCPQGTFKTTIGEDPCTVCPVGTTHTSTGATSSSVCNICTAGYYMTTSNFCASKKKFSFYSSIKLFGRLSCWYLPTSNWHFFGMHSMPYRTFYALHCHCSSRWM